MSERRRALFSRERSTVANITGESINRGIVSDLRYYPSKPRCVHKSQYSLDRRLLLHVEVQLLHPGRRSQMFAGFEYH